MKTIKLKYCILLILILIFSYTNCIASDFTYNEDNVTTVYNLNNEYLFSIAMRVTSGDKYISQNNIEYEVIRVEDNKAYAKKIAKLQLVYDDFNQNKYISKAQPKDKKIIAIYHTHNDESYLPGKTSENGKGDIHEIGEKLANNLKKEGIEVIYSENLHLPHDGAAYERSKGTALELVRKNPDAIFDIHRDAIPNKDEYLDNVGGKTMSQIRLVVGRQNPNRNANDQFAKSLKAVSDEYYPGLIRDIFYGGGAYNQQLSPRSLLLEFGSHVTGKTNALSSAGLFSEIVNQLLYGSKSDISKRSSKIESNNLLKNTLLIVMILFILLFGYLYINEKSISGVKKRVKKYFTQEIIDKNDGDNDV